MKNKKNLFIEIPESGDSELKSNSNEKGSTIIYSDTKDRISSRTFFDEIYRSIDKFSNKKVDMITIYQLTNFPLFICDKLVRALSKKRRQNLTQEEFSKGFTSLYFGSLEEKAVIIFDLCDFKHEGKIWIYDVRLLLFHFHMLFKRDNI